MDISPITTEMRGLIDALRAAEMSPAQTRRLSELLRQNDEARMIYIDWMHQQAALRLIVGPPLVHSENWPGSSNGEFTHDLQDGSGRGPLAIPITPGELDFPPAIPTAGATGSTLFSRIRALHSKSWPQLVGGMTLFALLLAVGITALVLQSAGKRIDENAQSAVEVAKFESTRNGVWTGSRPQITEGDSLYAGDQLDLVEGSVKLRFASGATVVVEAPSSIELSTALSMRLNRGTVAVRVDGPIKDFVVAAPDASIVDLGTSFGVHHEENMPTEVEVFEGAVEVFPEQNKQKNRVLGVGATAKIAQHGKMAAVDMAISEIDRYGGLLELLWEDIGNHAKEGDESEGASVVAEFNDAPIPGSVDTFYGAVRGRGWLTSWVASGNPTGNVVLDSPLSGEGNPYLRVNFFRSRQRTIARAYGQRSGFDPTQPHLISWKWRFDGTDPQYGYHFKDKASFYANPSFRRGSSGSNSWLIGMTGANERTGNRRKVFADRWYFFNGDGTEEGKIFDRRNMVDTGMKLKPGVVYQFAVAVYPQEHRYDAAIRDDEKTFVSKGLGFRSGAMTTPANVVHFCTSTNNAEDDTSFSLDSVRIEPLTEKGLEVRIGGM